MTKWEKLEQTLYYSPETGIMVEYGGMDMEEEFVSSVENKISAAISFMEELEAGSIANPDEDRMVGHYWLRAPEIAPTKEIKEEIIGAAAAVREFAAKVKSGEICGEKGGKFKFAMVAGMGGSSLGPAFIYDALGDSAKGLELRFLDNTDPAGMDRIFCEVEENLDETLLVLVSKSGGTVETRNSVEEAKVFYEKHGLDFAKHAVCVTGVGSSLDKKVKSEGWLAIFPMWDWVVGRASVMSAAGLLPLELSGIDTENLLRGAADTDKLTREKVWRNNPAAIIAMGWYKVSGGEGGKSMAVLPYRDSLALLGKYLQQLVMESLGKETDLDGKKVNQGLAVFGNKGSSDQHSYVQQLIDGPYNTFTTFVQTLEDRNGASCKVGEESTSGDYLNAFMLGTKKALENRGKQTMTVTVPNADAYYVGALIALFERAVGYYGNMVNVNAYNQPAVEFGKKAAGELIQLKNELKAYLTANKGEKFTAPQLEKALGKTDAAADIFRVLLHLGSNDETIKIEKAAKITDSRFFAE